MFLKPVSSPSLDNESNLEFDSKAARLEGSTLFWPLHATKKQCNPDISWQLTRYNHCNLKHANAR
jgi:hypothetical protein